MKRLLSLALCALAGTLCPCAASNAQQAASAVRIVNPIDENQLVTLKGNTLAAANAKNDLGPVSGSLPMAGLTLVLSRSPEQQAAFDAFVASQYDQGSPSFHQWLTPAQIGQRFGPAQADISTLSSWLASKGFAVKSASPDGMTIQFSGTAAQVQSAFHTEIHNLSVGGKSHLANMSDPQIPAALAPVIVGIKGLHNFLPHPLHRMGSRVQFNPDAHRWVKLQTGSGTGIAAGALKPHASASANSTSSSRPDFFYQISGNSIVEEDVAPYDFAKIYNLPSGWPNTASANGTGQTITVIGTSDIDTTDVANFKKAFGLPTGLTPVIAHGPDGDPGNCASNPSGSYCNSGDLDENSLDVEWSGAVAPGAQIVLVTDAYNSQTNPTNDPLFDGAQWAIDQTSVSGSAVSGSHILSLSYGQCELVNGTASNVAYNNLWQTAASAGIAVFVSTGDSGSPSCDDGGDQLIGNPYAAQYGLSVSGLASSPWDTAVGGTDFQWCKPTLDSSGNVNGCSSTDSSTYWNNSNSTTGEASAKGYVPERPWNDTCVDPIIAAYVETSASYLGLTGTDSTPEESCNVLYNNLNTLLQDYQFSGGDPLVEYVDTVGGSGGASNCVVSSTTSTTIGSCTAGATSTGSDYGNLALYNNGWEKPSWQAGVTGIPSDGVRDIPDVSFFAGDGTLDSATLICVANDGADCSSLGNTGSGNANGAEEIGGTSVATPEMAGVMALINQKIGAPQGNPNSELYALAAKNPSNCSAESVTTSGSCYFNDIDTGTNAMPCATTDKVIEGGALYEGGGQWSVGTPTMYAQASPDCTALTSGDVIGTLNGSSATAGYDLASGLGSLNVANVLSHWTAASAGTGIATVAVSLGGVTSISPSQSVAVTVKVTGSGSGPTGNVTLTAYLNDSSPGYSSTTALTSGSASFTIPANTYTAAGTVTVTAAYSGDSSYAASSGTNSFTVSSGTTTTGTFALATIPSPAGIAPGGTATATATVTASGGYAGTVTLNCALTASPSGAVNLPSCQPSGTIALSAGTTSGTATLSVTTTPITTSQLRKPDGGKGLFGASGAVLALLVFLGIPARRRSWRAMLGMVVLLVTLASLSACGGSVSTTTIPGTTAGTYTFTVTPSGAPAPSGTAPAAQTFNVTVN
jgi:subtilase family serine protease